MRFKSDKLLYLFLVVISVIFFSGCVFTKNSLNKNRNKVYKDWSQTLTQLGIFPIFPPREDVQVGDVWVLPMHPLNTDAVESIGGMGFTGIWMDNSIGTRTTVSDFYDSRFSFPRTGSNTAINDAKNSSNELKIMPVPRDDNNIFKDGDVSRLRQVAFPEFSFTNITPAAASMMIPSIFPGSKGGFNINNVEKISLKIPSAESYGLPVSKLLEKELKKKELFFRTGMKEMYFYSYNEGTYGSAKKGIPGFDQTFALLARSMFNESINNLKKGLNFFGRRKLSKALKKTDDSLWIAIISEVFYARAMDINIQYSKPTGRPATVKAINLNHLAKLNKISRTRRFEMTKMGRLSNKRNGSRSFSSGSKTEVKADDDQATVKIDGSDVNVSKIVETDSPFELAKKINAYNKELANQSVPGGSINVVSVSDTSVGLRRTFDRPIAVGARGLIIQIKVNEMGKTKKDGNTYEGFKVNLHDGM